VPWSLDAPVNSGTENAQTLADVLGGERASFDPDAIPALESAFRDALPDTDRWQLFVRMAYDGLSLRECAAEQKVPRSTFSHRIGRPIVQALAKRLGLAFELKPTGAADLAMIADHAARIWSREEFLSFCPPPPDSSRKSGTAASGIPRPGDHIVRDQDGRAPEKQP